MIISSFASPNGEKYWHLQNEYFWGMVALVQSFKNYVHSPTVYAKIS